MYFPIPVRSLLQNIISSKTFIFPPTIKELVHCNGYYDVYTGRKDCFVLNEKRLITFIMHRHDLITKKFTTSFETRQYSKDLTSRSVEFIHLTPESRVLRIDNLNFFDEKYEDESYQIQYHRIENDFCTRDISSEFYDNDVDKFVNIVNKTCSFRKY